MRAKCVSFIPQILFRRKCNDFIIGRKPSSTTYGGKQEPKEGETGAANADSRMQNNGDEIVGVSLSIYGQQSKKS